MMERWDDIMTSFSFFLSSTKGVYTRVCKGIDWIRRGDFKGKKLGFEEGKTSGGGGGVFHNDCFPFLFSFLFSMVYRGLSSVLLVWLSSTWPLTTTLFNCCSFHLVDVHVCCSACLTSVLSRANDDFICLLPLSYSVTNTTFEVKQCSPAWLCINNSDIEEAPTTNR